MAEEGCEEPWSLEVPQERVGSVAGSEEDSIYSEVSHTFTNVEPELAARIAEMEVMDPEVLRVTPAAKAFLGGAWALRKGHYGDLFFLSQKSDKIPTFWSHSWHGGQWKKTITLILFYSGRPAIFFSFLTACLLMPILFGVGVLPGFSRIHSLPDVQFTTWSLASGGLVAALVVVLWRPQTPVFFDRICISQADVDMKAMAIFSLAGLLKKSDAMLILWDPTWTERLWCLFELAAFLKSSEVVTGRVLIVRPTFIGPISVAMFLTITAFVSPLTTMPVEENEFLDLSIVAGILGIVVAYSAVSVFRKYFRDLDVMKEQLSVISFDRTRSSCCEQRHITPSGNVLPCDRKIVKESVTIWFGSQEAFEHTVRSQVLDILTRELSEKVFSTTWVLSVTSPIMWAFVDLSVSFLSYCCDDDAPDSLGMEMPGYFLEGLSLYLLAVPSIAKVLILLCKLTRRRPANVCLEILKNTGTLFLFALPVMLVFACFIGSRPIQAYGRHRMVTAGIFATSMLLLSVFWWVLAFGLKSLLKRPGW